MSTISSAAPAAGAPSVRAQALDDAIVGDAVLGEIPARQVDVFGRHPHPLPVPRAMVGRDILEVGHRAHVDPGLRRGDDDIGAAEAQRRQQREPLIGVGDLLAHQILAGDAEMRRAARELADDFRGREIGHFHAGQVDDRAAIVARAAPLHEFQPCPGEERGRVLLQPALRGDGEDERGLDRHRGSPASGKRSTQIAAPTAGRSLIAPMRRARPS